MHKIESDGLALWQFEALANEPSLRHFVTDRNTNINGTPFTMSFSSTPDKESVRVNRRMLAASMGVSEDRLFLPSQVHQTRTVHVTPHTSKTELQETDALVTSHRGICIAVMSADCVPILLWDKKHRVIGAVHSGWRGTVARILEKTLHEMHDVYGTRGENIVAAIGPSVSQESYEVGMEVVDAINEAYGADNGLLIKVSEHKAKADLWKANIAQLLDFGVLSTNIEVSNLCTVINNHSFFSARKGDTGRFAAGIVMV